MFKKNELWKNAFTEFNMHLYQAKGYQRYELLDEFLKNAASWRILAVESLCGLCRDTFELLEFEAKGNGISLTGTDILREQMEECISLEEARRIMEAFAGQCHLTELQNAPKSKNIQLAVEYINAHYAEQLSLEQVAASVYLNPDYFSRAFKMETGQTFVNYLTDVRLSRSVWLLENTALRVQMIAQQVGYYNASYFSTIFKKKYGMSPYEYRRKEK